MVSFPVGHSSPFPRNLLQSGQGLFWQITEGPLHICHCSHGGPHGVQLLISPWNAPLEARWPFFFRRNYWWGSAWSTLDCNFSPKLIQKNNQELETIFCPHWLWIPAHSRLQCHHPWCRKYMRISNSKNKTQLWNLKTGEKLLLNDKVTESLGVSYIHSEMLDMYRCGMLWAPHRLEAAYLRRLLSASPQRTQRCLQQAPGSDHRNEAAAKMETKTYRSRNKPQFPIRSTFDHFAIKFFTLWSTVEDQLWNQPILCDLTILPMTLRQPHIKLMWIPENMDFSNPQFRRDSAALWGISGNHAWQLQRTAWFFSICWVPGERVNINIYKHFEPSSPGQKQTSNFGFHVYSKPNNNKYKRKIQQ